MAKRRYTISLSAAEAQHLRTFHNADQSTKHWPLGPNRTFRRRNETTFVVKEWVNLGMGRATVMTLGTAELREGSQVDVVIRTKSSWLGWLLIAAGAVCLYRIPRDGLTAALVGAGLILAGWLLYVKRFGVEADLDAVEDVLRKEVAGDWRSAR